MKLPKVPVSAEISQASLSAFHAQKPRTWMVTEARQDYGWDLWITPGKKGEVGEQFLVQLKGSEQVGYLADGQIVAQELEVSTVNWLARQTVPTALAVCDTAADGQPTFWIWMDEAIADVSARRPGWREQKTLTLHVPATVTLAGSTAEIEQGLQERALRLRIDRDVASLTLQALGAPAPPNHEKSSRSFLRTEILPRAQRAGLIDLVETPEGTEPAPVSEDDRALRAELTQVAGYLDTLHTSAAREGLERLLSTAESASPGTRARFLNLKGKLRLHEGGADEAKHWFAEAAALCPDEIKYASNVLAAEFLLARAEGAPLADAWHRSLDAILEREPAFAPALSLRAREIGSTSVEDAEAFLKGSSLWATARDEAIALLAELALDADPGRALETLEDLSSDAMRTDPFARGLRADALFRLATGGLESVQGLGPSTIRHEDLLAAIREYEAACRILETKGYPVLGEQLFRNAAIALTLAGRAREAADLCQRFLRSNADSVAVLEALTIAWSLAGSDADAIRPARRAHELAPDSPSTFKNLVLALYSADEHEGLLAEVRKRSLAGFSSPAEEVLCRELAAVAFAHIGSDREAEEQLELLRDAEESRANAASATAHVRRIQGKPAPAIVAELRSALEEYPDDVHVLTALLQTIGEVSSQNADEAVDVIERLASLRQLFPVEASILARAHRLKGELQNAADILAQARRRFPENPRLALEHSSQLAELGETEDAYAVLQEYVANVGKSLETYRQLGALAVAMGRLDEAIALLSEASRKEEDATARGEIACQLYMLRRRRGDPPKDILMEAMRFGETTNGERDAEARFILMCLMVPGVDLADEEVAGWRDIVTERMDSFFATYPHSHIIRRFQAPAGLPDGEAVDHMLTEVMAVTLPSRMKSGLAEIAARGSAWPLALRHGLLGSGTTIVSDWQSCTQRDEFAHGIHCSVPAADPGGDTAKVRFDLPVCIDPVTILTLAHLAILDQVVGFFPLVIVPSRAREMLELEAFGLPARNELAFALLDWMQRHRERIRIRRFSRGDGDDGQLELSQSGLWVRKRTNVGQALAFGVGESMLLAARDGLQLYAEESAIRGAAEEEWNLRSFGTLAVLRKLRQDGKIGALQESSAYARLIEANYYYLPVQVDHLHAQLELAINELGEPTIDELRSRRDLAPLLRCFAVIQYDDAAILGLAMAWLVRIHDDGRVPERTRRGLSEHLTWVFGQRDLEGVLRGVSLTLPLERRAVLWSGALVMAQRGGLSGVPQRLWSTFTSVMESLLPTDPKECQETKERAVDLIHDWLRRLAPEEADLIHAQLPLQLGTDGSWASERLARRRLS